MYLRPPSNHKGWYCASPNCGIFSECVSPWLSVRVGEVVPRTFFHAFASISLSSMLEKDRHFRKDVEHFFLQTEPYLLLSPCGVRTLQRSLQSLRMDPRASGGVYTTRHLLGMPARVRRGGRNVSLRLIALLVNVNIEPSALLMIVSAHGRPKRRRPPDASLVHPGTTQSPVRSDLE